LNFTKNIFNLGFSLALLPLPHADRWRQSVVTHTNYPWRKRKRELHYTCA